MTTPASEAPGRISGAELRVWLDWLGIDGEHIGRILGVRTDTVRRWVSGRDLIPLRVGDELQDVENATTATIAEVIATPGDMADPAVTVYRTDAELWAARPDVEPYPAKWWRMVVARATAEVPGVMIEWARRADAPTDSQS